MKQIPIEGSCTTVGCNGGLVALPGPHGKTRCHFARVECSVCGAFVRWSKWPRTRAHLLVLNGAEPCGTCGHPMLWITTRSGASMPLHLDGPPRTILDQEGVARVGWESHYAHCPNAAGHRRKGGS